MIEMPFDDSDLMKLEITKIDKALVRLLELNAINGRKAIPLEEASEFMDDETLGKMARRRWISVTKTTRYT